MYIRGRSATLLHCVSNNLLQQCHTVDALQSRRHTIHREAVASKVGEVESHFLQIRQQLHHHHLGRGRKLHHLGKQHLLRARRLLLHLLYESLIAYAYVGTILVDYHEARLHCRHHILTLILIVTRRTLFEGCTNLRLHHPLCGLAIYPTRLKQVG